jgi:hypothetical protein
VSEISSSYRLGQEVIEPGSVRAYELAADPFRVAYATLDEFPTGLVPEECRALRQKILTVLGDLGSYCEGVTRGSHRDGGIENAKNEEARALERAEKTLRRRRS